MNNEEAKVLLKSKMYNLLAKVSSFAIKPQTKITLLKIGYLSSFQLFIQL